MTNKELLFKLFTKEGVKVKITEKEEKIYDIPLIYALTDKTPEPLQWELDYIETLNRTIRELNYDISNIAAFRKTFVQNYLEDYDLYDDMGLDYDAISDFLVTTAQHKIFWDIEIKKVRPIVFFYINSIDPNYDWALQEERQAEYAVWDEENIWEFEKNFLRKHIDGEISNVMFEWDRVIDFDILKEEYLKDLFWNPFRPKWWQKYFLKNQRRFNFVATSRRAGKTTLAAYLIIRQIVLPKQEVVVVVPTLKNHSMPMMKAIKEFLSKYIGKTFKVNDSQHTITNTENGSTVKFYTGEKNDAIRGAAANLLICDEAAFLNWELYETASALLRTTGGVSYVISTVNPDSPKNWFYYNLISAEIDALDPNSNKMWMRVTLDDNPFIPEEDKEDIKKDANNNYKLFLAERYCTFIDSEDFNLKDFWKVDNDPVEVYIGNMWKVNMHWKVFQEWYKRYLICYDCAQNQDRAAVTVWWIREQWADIVMAEYMDWFWYWDQVELLKDLKNQLHKSDIVIDYTWPWVVVQQMFERDAIYTINVQTVGGNFEAQDWSVHRVWKDILKWKLQSIMWEKRIKWFSFENLLRIEFETYDDSWKRKYWHHNDMISSLMIWAYISERYWLIEIPSEVEEDLEQAKQELVKEPRAHSMKKTDWFDRYRKFWF